MSKINAKKEFPLDGRKTLEAILQSSRHGSVLQAVASLTIFSHPDTVAQTGKCSIFRLARDGKRRGMQDDANRVYYDDNLGPHIAFCGVHGFKKITGKIDLQLNHVWNAKKHTDYYTCLANICITPTFLAKLTDHFEEIKSCLQFRAFDLFDWYPNELSRPHKPQNYDKLKWRDPLNTVSNVENVYREYLKGKNHRVALSVRRYGWFFSNWLPDSFI
jgi:hypothetical protein